jgi:hypothetical protein
MQKTSKLMAVNSCLQAAMEAPVSSLTGNSGLNVQVAIAIIDEVARRLCGDGYSFNTFTTTLSLDADNKIPVDSSYVSIDWPDPTGYPSVELTERDGYLYDVTNDTDIFENDVSVSVIKLLDFEDLPQHARDYVLAKSIRMYTDRTVGSGALGQFTRQDEQETWARFRRTELKLGDYGILDAENYRRIILRRF